MKPRKKKLFKIYFIVIIFVIIITFLVSKNIELFLRYRELDARNDQIVTKIEGEEKKKEEMEIDLEFLNTDKGQEKILLEKNNLKKPGEWVIKILDY